MTPKNLFIGDGVPPKPTPTPPPRPKSLFDGDMKTHAVSGVYVVKPYSLFDEVIEKDLKRTEEIKTMLTDLVPKGEKPTGPKTLLQDAKIRKRIDVTLEQLRKYNEDVKVIKVSQQQILETNIDELCLKYVLDWGSHLQSGHSLHLRELMAFSTADALSMAKSLIGELVQSMSELDVTKATKDSWFKSKEKKADELKDKLTELQDTAKKLRCDWLLSLHGEATELKKKLNALRNEMEPYIVTCSFFAEHDKDGFPKELYLTRLSSLLSTKASIGNDLLTMDAILATYVAVIETVNSIIRNELPMWISNFASVLSGNAADLTSLQTTKTNIINKLTKAL